MKSKRIYIAAILFLSTIPIQAQTKNAIDNPNPKVFVVLDITVNDSIIYEEYRINVETIVQNYGGK